MFEMIFPVALGLFFLTIGVLAVNPVFGIPLLFISKPFIDTTFARPAIFGFKLTELIGVLVPLIILVHMMAGSRDRTVARLPFKVLWLLYVSYMALFALLISFHQDWRAGANVFFRYFNGFVGFYMLQAFFLTDDRRKWLWRSLIVAGLFPVVIGLVQMVTGVSWRVEQSEGVLRNIGLWHDAVNIRQYTLQTLLVLLLYSVTYVGAKGWKQIGLLMYMGATVLVCVKSYSKAGLAVLGLWVGCWGLLFRKYAVLLVPGFTVLLIGGLWVVDLFTNVLQVFQKEIGFLSGDIAGSRTFAGRWFSWQSMIEQWQHYDWFKKVFGAGEVATGAHNDFLQMLFHGGLLGLILYVLVLGSIGMKILLNLHRQLSPMNLVALMAFLMWLVDTIGLVPSAYPGYQWFVWGVIGLALRLHAMGEQAVPAQTDVDLDKQEVPTLTPIFPGPSPVSPKRFPLLSP